MSVKQRILLCILCMPSFAYGMNLLRPYDTLLRPEYSNNYRMQFSLIAETGVTDEAYSDDCSTNPLRIWNQDQNALAMLCGFSDKSEIGKKKIAVDASDDGTRGHLLFDGDLKNRFSALFGARVFFKENWSLGLYLPFYAMQLKNVCFVDQTKNISDEDVRVKELLTDNFAANIFELGNGLELCDWSRAGVGDLTLLLDWFHDFPQVKPMLKNARVKWRLGLGMPTGLRQDEDKLFAFPYGYDGAFSLPFGVGLDLHFIFYLRAGFDVQLTHVFGNTRTRRFMTDQTQTDLLFLQKAEIYKDWGLTQQFNLYLQLYKFLDSNFSMLLGYQYLKHGADEIALPSGSPYSESIANAAESLKEWTIHQFVARADYDIGGHMDEPSVYPRASLYAQIPFNGKRSAATVNLGLTLSLDF